MSSEEKEARENGNFLPDLFFFFFACHSGNFFPTDCFGSYEGPPVLVSTS
jgi:hypothetical protein